jgi:glycosyltransferase involved in cell wall biosynthesis
MNNPQSTKGKALIIEENSRVPTDVRVWYEATTLRDNGWEVTVICPASSDNHKASGQSLSDIEPVDLEGVSVYYFPLPKAKEGMLAFLEEYVLAFISISRLCWRVWRDKRFDILHICNPPDMFFPVALFYRLLGAGVIFDHHDLFPEFISHRYSGWLGKMLNAAARAMEFLTYQSTHLTITVNQSYGRLAVSRGNVSPENVIIVRNGPKAEEFSPVEPILELKKGFPIMVSYLGVMGYGDGIPEMIDSIHYILMELGRRDIFFTLIGDGAKRAEALQKIRQWGLDENVYMPGTIRDRLIIRQYLSTSDICLSPEPLTPLNAHSTFIKVAEYMAMGKPVVAYNLAETRWTAGDSAMYVEPGDIREFGRAVVRLADQHDQRLKMGTLGRERIVNILGWEHQEALLLHAYEKVLNRNLK